MTIKISDRDFSSLLRLVEGSQTDDGQNQYIEIFFEYPQEFGEGYILDIKLRQGFWLTIANCQRRERILFDSSEWEHPLQFRFHISGTIYSRNYGAIATGGSVLCGSGMAPPVLYESLSLEPDKTVDIHIEPEVFKILVGIEGDAMPTQIKHLFRQPDREYYVRTGIITTQQQVILQQIWQCPYQGLVKRMYLESKVLELMALQLQQEMEIEAIAPNLADTLERNEIERIYQAKEILEYRLENPPSMTELAVQVGLSHYQLKQGFRKVFGTTAFQYLHNYRMEQARLLLYEGNMRVAEVANMVGYSHLGQFAAAFKRKFGISPSDCLKGEKSVVRS